MSSLIYLGDGHSLPTADLVGGKAAALATLMELGIRVPSAFVLPTTLCAPLLDGDAGAEADLTKSLERGIQFLERSSGLAFGDRRRPLLVSVRSGAAVSMPGMLDTVLNVGCNHTAVRGLFRWRGNPRLAWDCRRRLIEGYAETVLSIPPSVLEARLRAVTMSEGVRSDHELDGEALERICASYESALADADTGVPDDPMAQLRAAASAVFASWNSERAVAYRRMQGLDGLAGTAVTVQVMAFGNADARSAAGVAFSRDPSTGANRPVIDVLFEAQGEDVVSGRRSPETDAAIARRAPEAAGEIGKVLATLEAHYGDVQDVEFTIESGELFILQTRSAKRTPRAALKIALDLFDEHLITADAVIEQVGSLDPDSFRSTRFEGGAAVIGTGQAASPGVASGRIALDSIRAKQHADQGEPVVLVRRDTSTEDVEGFNAAVAIVTALGGRTAHAALIARQMNKPCVVGCVGLTIDDHSRSLSLGGVTMKEGDWISIDGDAGSIFAGRRNVIDVLPQDDLDRLEMIKRQKQRKS